MKRLVLIDSHAVIHRAFHALPPLTSPTGQPVQAVYGFALFLMKMFKDLKPNYVAATFDHEGPTFRHLAFERYKAQRVQAPDALYQQIPLVKELVQAFGIPVIELKGYEADDLIGTIAAQAHRRHSDVETVIVTGDLDTLQLVDRRTRVFTMKKGPTDTVLYDEAAVRARYGLSPRALIDFKGLRGDPSDNVPGVKGIGDKTAADLIGRHGSIEGIYSALKKGRLEAKPGVIAALKSHEADALFSKTLVTIDRHAPLKFTLAASRVRKANELNARAIFLRLGFRSLLARMGGVAAPPATEAGAAVSRQVRTVGLAAIPSPAPALMLWDADRNAAVVAGEGRRVAQIPLEALAGPDVARWLRHPSPHYVFNAKFFVRLGLPFDPAHARDLALMWYLLDPGRRAYEPEELVARELGAAPATRQAAAVELLGIALKLDARLGREDLARVYDEIEAPLVPILAAMEERGIGLDTRPLKTLSKKLAIELAQLETRIHRLAGTAFNIHSPRQLSGILFDRLGLTQKGMRRTEKSGVISTRESELEKLKYVHPIVPNVLRYRELAKLQSTYVEALPKLVAADGRVHTTWNQMGTATGRLASSNPNLQNIPIRSPFGREIRKAFTAGKGNVLVAFDYSQLELRIAADIAGDNKMMNAFSRGLDIHRLTAAEVNNVPLEKVTPDLRQKAKTLNFGILYGMGARSFAESAGISRDEAEHFIEEYFRDFAGIARYIEATKTQARELGFTTTVFGRKRFFPDLAASNFRLQRDAERMAVNHPIQGSEADIMKKAMIEVDRYLGAGNMRDEVRLLLQIHDELVFEIKKERVGQVVPEIRRIMESVWTGKVVMKVEVKKGANWGTLE